MDQKILVTTDMIVRSGDKILLIQRKNDPFKDQWALPGGFVENHERMREAALRELKEETNIDLHSPDIRFVGYFDAPERDPRGRAISFAFSAHIEKEAEVKAGDDAGDAQWFNLDELPELAFDHADIVSVFLKQE